MYYRLPIVPVSIYYITYDTKISTPTHPRNSISRYPWYRYIDTSTSRYHHTLRCEWSMEPLFPGCILNRYVPRRTRILKTIWYIWTKKSALGYDRLEFDWIHYPLVLALERCNLSRYRYTFYHIPHCSICFMTWWGWIFCTSGIYLWCFHTRD